MNKVVARYADGRMVKGMTSDFSPAKDVFHVTEATAAGGRPLEIHTTELKALFFVKDFAGNPKHNEKNQFDPVRPAPGRRLRVVFKDGEVLVGATSVYQQGRPGFFMVPADPDSNIARCYIIVAATRRVDFV
jgi:hypothetical protein